MSEPADLLQRLRAGDRDALDAALEADRERFARLVHARLDSRLRRRVDAEDVLQEAWLAASQRLQHISDQERSAFLWLRAIVLQTLVDVHRHHLGVQGRDPRREATLAPAPAGADSQALARELAGSVTSPSRRYAHIEQVAAVVAALGDLRDTDREVLALRHQELLDNHEVASVLGISAKTASIRYVRALKRLQGSLNL